MNLPRIIIAGAHSGVGKTTISIGLMAALVKRGLSVQPFKVGPDYIDPAFHTHVTGRKCRNLDSWMLEENTLGYLFEKSACGAEVSVIEGVMGMYDGFGATTQGSTAHVAGILKAPVILIINGSGISSSAAAMVKGYREYGKDVEISGVIVNRASGEKHFELLKTIIERDTGIPVIGWIPNNSEINLPSRHLGLIPSVELEDLNHKLQRIGDLVETHIDIDKVLEISRGAPVLEDYPNPAASLVDKYKVKIGISMDKAFNFYYYDNFDLLEQMGAEPVYFSPMEDEELPQGIDGLYLGGGFPEIFARQLEQNGPMRMSIKREIEKGIPTYAECGGLMYLTNTIRDFEGSTYEVCGIFDGCSEMTGKLQRFGYVEIELKRDCILGCEGLKFKAHEFHRSITRYENIPCSYNVVKWRDGQIIGQWNCGLTKQNVVAGYAHVHFWSNPGLAEGFVKSAQEYHHIKKRVRP